MLRRREGDRRFGPEALGELALAAGVILFGALVLYETTQIRVTPAYAKVGPRVIPYIVGAGLVLVGVWLAVQALRGRLVVPSAESEDADPRLPTDWQTVGMLAAALVVYLLLIERAGFVVASALLYFGAAFAMGSRRIGRDLLAGAALAIVVYVAFTRGLDLQLPAGVFERFE